MTASPITTMLLEDEALSKGNSSAAATFSKVVGMAAGGGMKAAALYGWNPDDGPFPTTKVLAFVDAVLALPTAAARLLQEAAG